MSKVRLTNALKLHDEVVYDSIIKTLLQYNINVELIESDNIWCRDYMPVPIRGGYILFNYNKQLNPYNKNESYNNLKVDYSKIKIDNVVSEGLNIEGGGNLVYNEKYIILTDKVFEHNKLPQWYIIDKLTKLFNKQVIIIPCEPGDELGHADGIVRFIDNKYNVFVNDYSSMIHPDWDLYQSKLNDILINSGLNPITLPYAYNRCPSILESTFRKKFPYADDFNPGYGYYINYLITKEVILYPTFGLSKDNKVKLLLEKYYNRPCEPIDCRRISMEGGLVNCVTWNEDYNYI